MKSTAAPTIPIVPRTMIDVTIMLMVLNYASNLGNFPNHLLRQLATHLVKDKVIKS